LYNAIHACIAVKLKPPVTQETILNEGVFIEFISDNLLEAKSSPTMYSNPQIKGIRKDS